MAILGPLGNGVCLVGAPPFRSGPTPKFCQVANYLAIAPYCTPIRPLDPILWPDENRSQSGFWPKVIPSGQNPQKCSSEIASKNRHQIGLYRAHILNLYNFWCTDSILMGPKYVRDMILESMTPRRRTQYVHPKGTNPQFWKNFSKKIFFPIF